MPNPLRTLTLRAFVTPAALALSLGLLAGVGPAGAAPLGAGSGLTSPGLQVEDVGYKRYRRYQQVYPDYYVSDYYAYGPSYRVYRDIPGGNNEIRELQRLFPETNWPPSLRY